MFGAPQSRRRAEVGRVVLYLDKVAQTPENRPLLGLNGDEDEVLGQGASAREISGKRKRMNFATAVRANRRRPHPLPPGAESTHSQRVQHGLQQASWHSHK